MLEEREVCVEYGLDRRKIIDLSTLEPNISDMARVKQALLKELKEDGSLEDIGGGDSTNLQDLVVYYTHSTFGQVEVNSKTVLKHNQVLSLKLRPHGRISK